MCFTAPGGAPNDNHRNGKGYPMSGKRFEIYQCPDEDCQVLVEMVEPESCDCDCNFQCCDKAMAVLEEKTADAATEKHVPVVEKTADGAKVVVGSTPHPMADDHWIQFIEIGTSNGQLLRQFLNPGDAPEAVFKFDGDVCCVREHCNKHGLWKS